MLQILLEDAEKNTIIGECQIVVLSFLLTSYSDRWKHFTERNALLAVHILYVMYTSKRNILEVVERQEMF
jgi:hypothetical protein